MELTEVKQTWFDRLPAEERKRRSEPVSKRSKQVWDEHPENRKKLSRKMKKNWKDNKDGIRDKHKEGLERSKRRTHILMGLEEESD